MQQASIISTGMYVPKNVIDNQFFNEVYGEDVDTWLQEHVQIYKRCWCDEDESTADLAFAAASRALENSGISARDLDLIIVATDTPEYISPSTASVVQFKLGASNAGTFDLNAACAGFVTAMDLASKYIHSDQQYQHILVIGAYAMSKYLNLEDKKTATLFADGAAAVLLKSTSENDHGWLAAKLMTKGQYHDWMGIYGGGARYPLNQEVLDNHRHQLEFVHKFPRTINPDVWSEIITDLSGKLNIKPDAVDHYLITQINIFSIWETMDRLNIDRKKAHTIMHQYGYTGSACIPMALDLGISSGKIKRGDLIFLVGSGGGLAFAGVAFRY